MNGTAKGEVDAFTLHGTRRTSAAGMPTDLHTAVTRAAHRGAHPAASVHSQLKVAALNARTHARMESQDLAQAQAATSAHDMVARMGANATDDDAAGFAALRTTMEDLLAHAKDALQKVNEAGRLGVSFHIGPCSAHSPAALCLKPPAAAAAAAATVALPEVAVRFDSASRLGRSPSE